MVRLTAGLLAANLAVVANSWAALPGWTLYTDARYGLSFGLPPGFVVRPPRYENRLSPTPVRSLFVMNPAMAAGELAGIEPPDLQVQVYRNDERWAVEEWLQRTGLASTGGGATLQPYINGALVGVEVCARTLIAPGCSIFVQDGGVIVQLTPLSREGQSILTTFVLRH